MNTIKKSEIFDEVGYTIMINNIRVLCKMYIFINALTLKIFEDRLLKSFEDKSQRMINEFFTKST